MKSTGICIGASNITIVQVESGSNSAAVHETRAIPHEGNPFAILSGIMNDPIVGLADRVAITGRKVRTYVNMTSLSEPEALEEAYGYQIRTGGSFQTIVSAGGESFMLYKLDNRGRIVDVRSGNKCASGTGEFFLQQIKRMNYTFQEAMDAADVSTPYMVAGRCSVFCKSDCTHALNKGAAKPQVVAGLCSMMAEKLSELLKRDDPGSILLVGGSASNHVMVHFLRQAGFDVTVPKHSFCFEALGAALWALSRETLPVPAPGSLFQERAQVFPVHPPIKNFLPGVRFMEIARDRAGEGDRCVLGLDVGSTTTKAVLLRSDDKAVLASVYLRTNGDPIGASRQCYAAIHDQLAAPVNIVGLGVTGSGRQISALHALTPCIVNEIIAHARAAAHFDPAVDTVFEIGGQDAKYTYLTNGVISDYTMNEACSAGTGSFLEEAAFESLSLPTVEIGPMALEGSQPPNFSDQCSAFIGSDIKTAIQCGISKPDIAAGLVYSVCTNYLNRVKGNRAVGSKVFMQGGVCYNRAVPAAMAALTGKEIIVPPEPGLMGAFGVALEILSQIELGLYTPQEFQLEELANREAVSEKPFVCAGGSEKCDRKCKINRYRIHGRIYPFGGACNKYYNMLNPSPELDYDAMDLVAARERLLLTCSRQGQDEKTPRNGQKIGINSSLMTNTLFPLYYTFFDRLGYEVLFPSKPDSAGFTRKGAAFCWPVEQSHGMLKALLNEKPDIVFLPHIKALPVLGGGDVCVTCPFVQSEPYLLKAAFPELASVLVLSPVLDMTKGIGESREEFLRLAAQLGQPQAAALAAFEQAAESQCAFQAACRREGQRFLEELEKTPDETAVVVFGRPYNALSAAGNMGIPKKLVTRGYKVIPMDFLPVEPEESFDNMYWASGQWILKAARFVQRHPQLYGAYITNFSCGPDSFVIGYFRDIMGQKPSLTLELDSHTADAGLDTRIEAYLDVVKRYRILQKQAVFCSLEPFQAAHIERKNGKSVVMDSTGAAYPLTSPRVKVLIPSMGDIASRMMAATLRHVGVNAIALPPAGKAELDLGRSLASCKECLPLLLTAGSLVRYVKEEWNGEDVLVNFMPETSGPCRFGQYNVMMRELVRKLRLPNITMLSLTAENAYAGFGVKFALRAWQTIVLSDILDDVASAVLALAVDPDEGLNAFERMADSLCASAARDTWPVFRKKITAAAQDLSRLPRKGRVGDLPSIALIGEIYVRRDNFSRQNLVETLSRKGFLVQTSQLSEWIHYCDYIVQNKLVAKSNFYDRARNRITCMAKSPYEDFIRKAMTQSGFYKNTGSGVDHLVSSAQDLISPRLTGETILTVGAAMADSIESVDGVLALGPFGCMPARISEAIITQSLNEHKPGVALDRELVARVMQEHNALPFLSLETDGNPFPQLIESRLEAFLLQVLRVHEAIQKSTAQTIERV
jgi:predicted CoA-substrate-specific enzyme activase